MTKAYMFIALIIASGSCQEPRLIVQKMASLELCQAATNLATRAGGQADCVPVASPPTASSDRASAIVGKRDAPTAPTGQRRRSSSSIVLS
jgi:hypothetical protein